jgi:hypothetical protein
VKVDNRMAEPLDSHRLSIDFFLRPHHKDCGPLHRISCFSRGGHDHAVMSLIFHGQQANEDLTQSSAISDGRFKEINCPRVIGTSVQLAETHTTDAVTGRFP